MSLLRSGRRAGVASAALLLGVACPSSSTPILLGLVGPDSHGEAHAVLIESVWDESKKPDADTINGLRGKRVAVSGSLNASPPGRIANMAIPTVSPVDKLELIE
jgi:hypothetical protein